jgi:hypothetical protein
MHEVSRPCVLMLDCYCLANPCTCAPMCLWAYVLVCYGGKLLFLLDFFHLYLVFCCYCVVHRDSQRHLADVPNEPMRWHDIVFLDKPA